MPTEAPSTNWEVIEISDTEVIVISSSDDEDESPARASSSGPSRNVATQRSDIRKPGLLRTKKDRNNIAGRKLRQQQTEEAKRFARKMKRNRSKAIRAKADRAKAEDEEQEEEEAEEKGRERVDVTFRDRKRSGKISSGPGLLLIPSASTSMIPAGVECSDRPPTPPSFSAAPRLGLGARSYPIKLLTKLPTFDPNELPFSISEIPSFERSSWLNLSTHRYVVVSSRYPRSPEACQQRAAELKTQLLSLFRLTSWSRQGKCLEPKISFPRVEGVNKDFVDITFASQSQRDIAREPRPPLKFQYDALTPFVHSAYIDSTKWFVLQFAHPNICNNNPPTTTTTTSTQNLTSSLETTEAIRKFGIKAANAVARSPPFKRIGKPVAIWSIPEDFPHCEDFTPTDGIWNRIPQYILLLERDPTTNSIEKENSLCLPAYLEILNSQEGDNVYVKVWWDGKPIDLCNYCKNATDGHTNRQCTRGSKTINKRPPQERPAVY